MENWQKRIRRRIDRKPYNGFASQFSASSGVAAPTVRRWMRETVKSVTTRDAIIAPRELELTVEWLFGDHDEAEPPAAVQGGDPTARLIEGLGMAIAAEIDASDRRAVAIIGDGGLTGGMAFEALNHAGALDPNLLVILNDNEMSISENVGALTHYLGRILT